MYETTTYENFPFKLKPIKAAILTETELKRRGGIFKAILGIAISIAIPVMAPKIAAAVFASTAPTVLQTALVGGVLGGGASAVLGDDPLKGAIFGGLGAGAAAYQGGANFFSNPSTVTSPSGVISTTGEALSASGAGLNQGASYLPNATNTSVYTPLAGTAEAAYTPSLLVGGQTASQMGQNIVNAGGNIANTLSTPLYQAANVSNAIAPNLAQNTISQGVNQAVTQPGFNAETLMPTNIDRTKMIDAAIVAAPKAIGTIYAANMESQYDQQIKQYEQELAAMKDKESAAYQEKFAVYQDLLQQAKNFSPESVAQEQANQANINTAKRSDQMTRDVALGTPGYATSPYASSEARRFALGATQNVGTAYNQGYTSGLDTKNQMTRNAYNAIPSAPTNYLNNMSGLQNLYGAATQERAEAAKGVGQTLSPFMYPFLSNEGRDRYKKQIDQV
jgi:hypothetical protein